MNILRTRGAADLAAGFPWGTSNYGCDSWDQSANSHICSGPQSASKNRAARRALMQFPEGGPTLGVSFTAVFASPDLLGPQGEPVRTKAK
jgi:hypothetical protein